ncbi:MAG TPA: hypothetical protein VNG73_08820 [Gemmatimonadaceae bacterium]|jgi:hypothetical protein|nr:hypothetical protein [Gemmatimonadaceae bacterium]
MRKFATIGMSLVTAASISIPALAMSSAFAAPSPAVQGVTVPARPVPSQRTASTARERREPHPEIRKAIAALERAKYDMQHANHDFGGHRVAALAACDKAIEQLRLALQYDKR